MIRTSSQTRESTERKEEEHFDVSFGRKKIFYDCFGAIFSQHSQSIKYNLKFQ